MVVAIILKIGIGSDGNNKKAIVTCNISGRSSASDNYSVGKGVVVVALVVEAAIMTRVVIMVAMVVAAGGNGCIVISIVVVVVVVIITVEVVRSLGSSSNGNNVHSRSVGGNGGEGKC